MTSKTTTKEDSKESTKECGCTTKEEVTQQNQSDIDATLSKAPDAKNADGDIDLQANGGGIPKEMAKKKPVSGSPNADGDKDEDEDEDEEETRKEVKRISKLFNEQQKKLQHLESQLTGQKPATFSNEKPTAMIASNKEGVVNWETLGQSAWSSIKEHGFYSYDVSIDPLYKEMAQKTVNYASPHFNKLTSITPQSIQESFSTSGTIPGVDLDRDFLLLPGGTYMKPVRQYTKFAVVPQGTDRVRFFTSTIPASATQTAGSAASDSTYTLTSVEVVPSTISGHVNSIYTNNLEDFPVDLMKATTQAAIARMMDFEADQAFDVAAQAATPGEWINGSGSVITQDDASGITFSAAAIAEGRKFLELKGYPVDRLVLALAPQQYKELATDSNIVRFVQANAGTAANISTTGLIERYLGVELLVTNKVAYSANTTNHALRACMFVKNWTFALGVKRDLTIKMREVPESNEIIVTGNWRSAATVLDGTSFVRISSTTTQAGQNG